MLPLARVAELRLSPVLAVVLYTLLSGSASAWAQSSGQTQSQAEG